MATNRAGGSQSRMPRLATLKSSVVTLDTRKAKAATTSNTQRIRGDAWMKLRARILIRDRGMCQCEQCQGVAFTATQVDHCIPLWEGGTDDEGNLQAINTDCHKRKTADEARRRGGGGGE